MQDGRTPIPIQRLTEPAGSGFMPLSECPPARQERPLTNPQPMPPVRARAAQPPERASAAQPPVRPSIATAAIAACLDRPAAELAMVVEFEAAGPARLPPAAVLGYAACAATGEVFPPGAPLPPGRTVLAAVRIPLPAPPAPADAALDAIASLAANGWRIELQPPLAPALTRSVPAIRAAPADLAASPGADGDGVLVGVVDFGCDFAHPAFLDPQGRSRLAFLWDQNSGLSHDGAAIAAALAQPDPYAALGYRPDDNLYTPAVAGGVVHGTHVLSVAAGRGTAECPAGVAPASRLAFVHLRPGALVSSGDPADVFDGVCAIMHHAAAARLPAVVNLSLGANAGSHDGNTTFDRALDALLQAPGRAICVAAGNERQARLNMDAAITSDAPLTLPWQFAAGDVTPNTLRVLCDAPNGLPPLSCRVRIDGAEVSRPMAPGANAQLLSRGGAVVGVLYSGITESSHAGPLQQLELRLLPSGKAEAWDVTLASARPGPVHIDAWIDRDDRERLSQSSFAPPVRTHSTLTSTACGRRTICVGAFDQTAPAHPPAPFSAEGTTRDGREKPDVSAPGIGVLAAAAYGGRVPPGQPWRLPPAVRMTGTSVAAPHVAGVVALLLQRAPGLTAEDAAACLRRTARADVAGTWHPQLGWGRVDAAAALASIAADRRGAPPGASLLTGQAA